MKLFSTLFAYNILICTIFFCLSYTADAAINFTVTPIKYELELDPWESITLPATIKNNGSTSVTMPTATSDFTSRDSTGIPRFVRKSELVFPDQQLSTWITLSESSVTLDPGEEKSIDFTINVPEDAEPGGHYGAIFFKNPWSEVSSTGNVWINVDYGILVLVKVSWEVTVVITVTPPIITTWSTTSVKKSSGDCDVNNTNINCGNTTTEPQPGDWYIWTNEQGQEVYEVRDDCPLGDFTPSKFDGKCFWDITQSFDESGEEFEDFNITFSLPVKNDGNVHVQPTWKIVITDGDGKTLTSIGKEVIVNEYGSIVGEKIVDYIPINDTQGNVLPKTQRVFEIDWQGFPYEDYDEQWNKMISYWTPSEYYTRKNKQDSGFLMMWERASEVRKHEIMTANMEFRYTDENWEDVVFNSAQEFPVQYIETRVTYNPYIVLGLLLMFTALGLLLICWYYWWFLGAKKKRCWNCDEKIKSHWDTCPYCESLQNKKAHKKFLQQKENAKKQTRNSSRSSKTKK